MPFFRYPIQSFIKNQLPTSYLEKYPLIRQAILELGIHIAQENGDEVIYVRSIFRRRQEIDEDKVTLPTDADLEQGIQTCLKELPDEMAYNQLPVSDDQRRSAGAALIKGIAIYVKNLHQKIENILRVGEKVIVLKEVKRKVIPKYSQQDRMLDALDGTLAEGFILNLVDDINIRLDQLANHFCFYELYDFCIYYKSIITLLENFLDRLKNEKKDLYEQLSKRAGKGIGNYIDILKGMLGRLYAIVGQAYLAKSISDSAYLRLSQEYFEKALILLEKTSSGFKKDNSNIYIDCRLQALCGLCEVQLQSDNVTSSLCTLDSIMKLDLTNDNPFLFHALGKVAVLLLEKKKFILAQCLLKKIHYYQTRHLSFARKEEKKCNENARVDEKMESTVSTMSGLMLDRTRSKQVASIAEKLVFSAQVKDAIRYMCKQLTNQFSHHAGVYLPEDSLERTKVLLKQAKQQQYEAVSKFLVQQGVFFRVVSEKDQLLIDTKLSAGAFKSLNAFADSFNASTISFAKKEDNILLIEGLSMLSHSHLEALLEKRKVLLPAIPMPTECDDLAEKLSDLLELPSQAPAPMEPMMVPALIMPDIQDHEGNNWEEEWDMHLKKYAQIKKIKREQAVAPAELVPDRLSDAEKLGFDKNIFGNGKFKQARDELDKTRTYFMVWGGIKPGDPIPPQHIVDDFVDNRFENVKIVGKRSYGFKREKRAHHCVYYCKNGSRYREYPSAIQIIKKPNGEEHWAAYYDSSGFHDTKTGLWNKKVRMFGIG